MQKLVIEQPYRFITPHRGRGWSSAFRYVLPYYLRTSHGIVEVECRGLDRFRASVARGGGVLLAPNHCRLSDPMTLGWIVRETGIHMFTMASWHLFNQDRLADRAGGWMMRRLGAFSILREGTDRAALNCAIEMLTTAERPLVIFPEGVVSRSNDRLGPLMEGTTFIARAATRKAAKAGKPGVMMHPVALRYVCLDDVEAAVAPALAEFETRLTWQPRPERTGRERSADLQMALLSLKELEFTGHSAEGLPHDRRVALIEHLLRPLETEHLDHPSGEPLVTRVKDLRAAILPQLLEADQPDAERDRLRRQLAAAYLAQQLHFYPEGYLTPDAPPERLLETVERLEEDLTDTTRIYGRLKVIIDIGEAITVPAERDRTGGRERDPLLTQVEESLNAMLLKSAQEVDAARRPPQADIPKPQRTAVRAS